ncbi:MAG: hypothetical protein H0U82_04320 [Actinobacteria bacterium]|nr:hypothetical protein [Actinomycetota bacterium]
MDSDPLTPGDPCSSRTLSVKATDDDAPFLFGFIPYVADPKKHARVEIQQVVEQSGMLPWAVPEVDPASVAAIFVDENTGAILNSPQLLTKMDDVDLPFSEWSTSPPSDLFNISDVDIASENTGVVILVSKQNNTPSLSGTLAEICAQDPGLVTCYAGDGNQSGLSFIHGWSDAPATPAQPRICDVSLVSVTCGDDLSAPYFLRAGDCDLGAKAVIDFAFAGNPKPNPPAGIAADVKLDAPGCPGQGCKMEYLGPGATASESIWMTTQNATLDAKLGRADFSIKWRTERADGSKPSGTFSGVAHPYVANGDSGPVEYLKLTTADAPVADPNSRNSGPDRSVIVKVGLRKPFQVESPLAPPVVLRVASPSGSQNQAFDCDKSINFRNEIANGCQTTYRENYGDFDKDGISEWQDIFCAAYPNGAGLPPDSSFTGPTPNCVRVETGDKIGQFRQGLSDRFKNPSCAPNNWPESISEYDDFRINYDLANDPRYVTLIITDYGTFLSQGSSEAVPVKYFAGFYVTGWDIVGSQPECPDNEPHPWYAPNYRKSLDNGDVWGHFINITFSSSGQGNDELCNYDEVGTCIAVLVE